jgi:hypothetical protein
MLLHRLVEYATARADGAAPPFHRERVYSWQLELTSGGSLKAPGLTPLARISTQLIRRKGRAPLRRGRPGRCRLDRAVVVGIQLGSAGPQALSGCRLGGPVGQRVGERRGPV